MASTKVRGITIELGADTSGISQALKGVNSDIRNTQKELKDVDRLLKLDPTNTELLAQKQRLLADKVSETKEKLTQLKAAQESIDLSTEDGQRQYDALTREIVSCENELKKAEQEASGFNSTASKISSTAGKLSDKFGTLAEKTRGISIAAGGALAGLAGLAVKAGKDADDLNTLAKQTGVATDELQKMQYASDLIDVDVDTITGGLKKLKKNLDGHEESWERIGVNVKDANGEYKDITTIFYETAEGLSHIENETERDTVAMDLFGKSADELAGIIDDGGAALKELGQQAEDMGVIISQDDLDTANEFNDTLDTLKAEVLPTIAQLGIEIAQTIMPYLPQIKEFIEKALETLRQVSPQMLAIMTGVLALLAVLSPLFSVLSSIFGAISAVTGSAGGLSAAFAALTGPIGLTIAIIGALVAAFLYLWNTNEEFRNNIIAIWEQIKASFDAFGNGIVERLNAMGFEFESFSDVVRAIWEELCNFLAPIFEDTFAGIATVLEGALDILTGLFDVFAGIFTGNWSQVWQGVTEIFEGQFEVIKGIFGTTINWIVDQLNWLISKLDQFNFAGVGVDIPKIPKIAMANGGVLTKGTALVGEAGPELLTMSNGRAVVQPLTNNTNNYAGNTNNFYIQSNNPYEVAEQVSQILDRDYSRQESVFA